MSVILGLAGNMRVGKTTVANMIKDKLGDQCAILGMSNALREELAYNFYFDLEYVRSNEFKGDTHKLYMENDIRKDMISKGVFTQDEIDNRIVTGRELLQIYGTEYRRNFYGKNYWVDLAMKRADDLTQEGSIVIFDDLRFHSEMEAVGKGPLNVLIKLERYEGYDHDISHSSELEIDTYSKYDYEFSPKFGISHLEDVAKEILVILDV